jgi:hypothetical protein
MTVYLLFHGDDEPTMGDCAFLRGAYGTREAAIAGLPDTATYGLTAIPHTLREDRYDFGSCCWIDEQEVRS